MGLISSIKEAIFGPSVDYRHLIAQGAVVVDVRTKGEFQQGHAKKSLNIPLANLRNKIQTLQGKTVILVCRSGARAGQAKSILKNQGIEAHNAGPWQTVQ